MAACSHAHPLTPPGSGAITSGAGDSDEAKADTELTAQWERQRPTGPTENHSGQKLKLRTPGALQEGRVSRHLPDGENEPRPAGRGGASGRMGGLERVNGEREGGRDEAQTTRPPRRIRPRQGRQEPATRLWQRAEQMPILTVTGRSPTADAQPGRLRRSDLSEAGGLWVSCDCQSACDFQSKGCSVWGR